MRITVTLRGLELRVHDQTPVFVHVAKWDRLVAASSEARLVYQMMPLLRLPTIILLRSAFDHCQQQFPDFSTGFLIFLCISHRPYNVLTADISFLEKSSLF